jgi:hypothetical protein
LRFSGISEYDYTALEELEYLSWRDFYFFPRNWISFLVVVIFSAFSVLGIIIWRMFCVVKFMRHLNKNYDLVLRPYDVDESGGFGPLEKLWLKMSYVAIPILGGLFIISFLGYSKGSIHYPLWGNFDLVLIVFVFVGLLICPIWNYIHIVSTQKAKLLNDIEDKINRYYKRIEKTLIIQKRTDLEKDSLKQIKQLEEIMLKAKSISPWPFRTYQKAYILLAAVSPLIMDRVIPWVLEIIDYFG